MRKPPSITVRLADLASLLAILALACYGIFRLPYSFPLKTPVFDTPSYAAGFNNGVAVLALLGAIALLLLRNLFWRPVSPEAVSSLVRTEFPGDGRHRQRMPRSILFFFIGAYVGMTCFLYAFIPQLQEYGAIAHWLLRLRFDLDYHLQPYRDFEFAYGPAMHYLPALLVAMLSRLFGASYEFGYLVSLLISSLLGLWSLYYLVDHFRIHVWKRTLVFSVLALALYDWTLDISGTELRFAAPLAIALLSHKALNRLAVRDGGKVLAGLCGICAGSTLAVLAITLEFGVLFLIATAAGCLYRCLFQKRLWLFPLVATLACFPLWLVMFPGSLDRVLGGSNCFSNFPIFPAVHILIYLTSIFWLVPILLRTCLTRNPSENAPLMLVWAIMLVGATPAALGRCDMYHCLKNGLGTFLLTFLALAAFRPRSFMIYTASFALVFVMIRRAVDLIDFRENFEPVRLALGGALGSPPAIDPDVARVLAPHSGTKSVAIPMMVDRMTGGYLIANKCLAPQYHMSFSTVATQRELARKINDLKKAELLLVPKGVLKIRNLSDDQILEARRQQQQSLDRNLSIVLGTVFLYPVKFQTVYLPFDPMLEQGRYIADHYDVVSEAGSYLLMQVKQER